MSKAYKVPQKLQPDDKVMIVAPSCSIGLLSEGTKSIANQRFADLGLSLVFAGHVEETDIFGSASVQSRVEDMHAAFSDPEVKAIFTVIGGSNANQLLRYLDWNLIANNPKILCGYSDITALNSSILAKTGLVTYSGPHYSSFGEKMNFEYSLEYFKKCLFSDDPYTISPSRQWFDDKWHNDQKHRCPIDNAGPVTIHEGQAEGIIIGGNLCTLNLLQGTEFFPDLMDSVLFLEDDSLVDGATFDRDLQSLIHQPGFGGVRGLVIGRFQKGSQVDTEKLCHIVETKEDLLGLPVVVDVDFGHTSPLVTFPVGGQVRITASKAHSEIMITHH